MIVNPPLIPRMFARKPGLYYGPSGLVTLTTMSPSINAVYAMPYYSGENPKSSGVAFEVTGAVANAAVDIGLYDILNPENDIAPGRRIGFAGTVDCSTTGVKVVNWSPMLTKPMERNRWYWLAFYNTFAQLTGVRAVSQSYIPATALHNSSAAFGTRFTSVQKAPGTGLSDPFGAATFVSADAPLICVVAA